VVTEPTTLTGHTILIGYGRVGTVVGDGLQAMHAPLVIVEDAEGRINAARAKGIEVVIGNAASPKVLNLANVVGAKTVIVAIPNAFEAGQAVEQCRRQNPGLLIIARAHSDEEEEHLLHLGANTVILGEREIGMGMLELVGRDSSAVAEITAADAVAAALGTSLVTPKPVAEPTPDAETLLEEIEAAPVQHVDAGPAEPPAMVSAFGEEPDTVAAAETADPAIAETPVEAAEPVAAPDSLPFKARQPARTPATPFNPEVAPPEPVK
jgi:CPA2 family monovalent cation:H+ antiporter-2